jgi:type II secretory pathway predicted ATPase ExeA
MEIHSALDDDTMGVRAFTSFKNLLLELGYTGVFVFIDEFESIARLNAKQKQATLNSIRHLMDQNSSGLSVLFGCAPEVWQDVMSEYHAFSERIGNEVALEPLTEEQVEQLVSEYLDTARPEEQETIEPFEQETLRVILQRSQGNIRQILSLCGRTIDQGTRENHQTIAPDVVQQVLD